MKVPEPRKLSSGNYFIQLRLNGVSVPVTAATSTECSHKAALIKAEWKNGKREIEKKTDAPKISVILQRYIDSRRSVLSPSTIRGYNTIKDTRFQSIIDKPIDAVTDWQKVINQEVADGVKGKTIKNAWGLMCSAMKHAGYPVPVVKLPQVVQAERPWLDPDQIRIFVKAVQGADVEIPALLALHSLRRSEIAGLAWEKVDLDAGLIRIEGSSVRGEDGAFVYKETNKSRNSRRQVPIMIPELRKALEAVPKEKRAGSVAPCNPNTIWARVNRICEANGLPQVGVHGLRHSFASLAHHVGMPEEEAMLIGGWEDAKTMHKIYTHIANADRLKAQNLMAAFYSGNKKKAPKERSPKKENANKNANRI